MRLADDAQRAASEPYTQGVSKTDSLVAFHAGADPQMSIRPSSRWRDWMNAMPSRWANRCLPLLVANESGWTLLNPVRFTAIWSGGDEPAAVEILFEDPPPKQLAVSLFGCGIVTWVIPFVF